MANDIIKVLLQAEIDSKAISNIQQQINSVQKNIKPIKVSVNASGTQGVTQMTDAFEKLEQVTKKNLMLDLDKMSNRYKNLIKPDDIANIKSMISSLSHTDPKLGHNIDLIKVKMKEVSIGAEQSRKSLDLANKSAMSFGEAIKQAAYKFGIWSAITASYYKLIREISTGVKFITEMDTALTEIGMVTNQTREQTAGLAKEYSNLAKEMKVLTSEVTSGAVEFYRQGLSQEEVMERLRVTTMYSKIANVDFKQSAELLTATVNSMGVSIERAADVFLFLGDATATSGEEIGKGFSKTSGAAAALGVEFEKVASWIAVISSKTRESAESIGHSINTMLSRFSRITETGFNEEDDTKLNDVAKALNTVGIALTDQQGNFRNFGTIMDDINSKWAKLDDQTKSYIANTVAGTRQQSRFFNLMNGYAESMTLYSQSLEAAGTSQSKFNSYLESNRATLDKFRTTLEGLWLTILDSDSLMSLVKTATSFIETLDSMVQKFGTVGTVLNFLIPLMGIKLVWAIRSAYLEMVKLQATGSMSAFMPTSKILGQIISQMLGLKVATGGATVAVGGLTLATAGLTLGVGLLTFAIVKWAQKSREAKEAMANALDNSQRLNEEVKSLEDLAKKQEELTKIENKSAEQKEELLKVQRELAKLYPQLATGIDTEGNKIADNLEMTKQLTEEKRKLLEQELLVIKTTADKRLPQLRKELLDMQDEADRIQKRLVSGDTVETDYIEGYEIQVNKTQELKDRLLELVNAQKEHHEEISKLEAGVKSYNQILEENAERQKWATVEELKSQAAKAQTAQELEVVEKKLKDLGFTSEDTANIISGNIDLVKEKYKELDEQQIINLQTIENLDATQKQAMMNMLESSRQATKQLIEDTKARIKAVQAEMEALVALSGGKAKNTSVVSKQGELDPKAGLLSNLSTVAQNEAIKANQDLAKLEGNLADIEKALRNVSSIDTKQISGIRDPDKKKDNRQFLEAIDAEIRAIKLKNDYLLATEKSLQEQLKLAKDLDGIEGLNEQYRITGELIEHNKKMLQSFKTEQDLIHARANKLREDNKNYNIDSWFDSNGEATLTYINLYNNATKKQQEELDKVFGTMQKLKKSWMESRDEAQKMEDVIKDLGLELDKQPDKVKNIVKDLIEKEKKNAYLDLELRERAAKAALKAEKDKMDAEVKSKQDEVDKIQGEIDKIQESERARQESRERQKRLDEIEKLEKINRYLENDRLDDITEEQAKLVGLEKERESYLKRQTEIQKLQLKLDNLRNDKNIQQLTKLKDGSFDFTYVADEKEIDEVNKKITELQEEQNKTIKDLKESNLDNLKKLQEDYDEWEYQNGIQKSIREKQQRIKGYQDEMKDLQDKYAEKERLTNEAFATEKQNLDDHYRDIDLLTDNAMIDLEKTFDKNWTEIGKALKNHFDSISSAYLEMLKTLSQKPEMSVEETMAYNEGIAKQHGITLANNTPSNFIQMKNPNGQIETVNESYINDFLKKGYTKKHDGGIVGDGSRDLPEIVNKLFNTKPNEQMVKALKGELFIPEDNIYKNFLPNIQEVLKSAVLSTVRSVTPTIPKIALASGSGGDQIFHIAKLEFPNITTSDGLKEAILDLPRVTRQKIRTP